MRSLISLKASTDFDSSMRRILRGKDGGSPKRGKHAPQLDLLNSNYFLPYHQRVQRGRVAEEVGPQDFQNRIHTGDKEQLDRNGKIASFQEAASKCSNMDGFYVY